MRLGLRAVYRGTEYKAVSAGGEYFRLYANDDSDRDKGFILDDQGRLSLRVHQREFDELFDIHMYGEYHGIPVELVHQHEGRVTIHCSKEPPEELGFERLEMTAWFKWVRPEEIENLRERRTDYKR